MIYDNSTFKHTIDKKIIQLIKVYEQTIFNIIIQLSWSRRDRPYQTSRGARCSW